MKYKKGTKVEVLNKREVPSGSWWCAEIISGNGHTYSVRYDPSPSGMSELVERVPRKVIRPCPPSVQDPITWMSGDIIEVFDNGSWKLAEVCSTLDGNYFSVRVLGSSRVFIANKSDIRLRQCWKDNRWIVIEKDVRSSESAKVLNGRCQKRASCQGTSGSVRAENCEETTTYEEPKLVFFGGKRRGSQHHPFFHEPRDKVIKKMKTNGTDGKWWHFYAEKPHSIPEKVDAVASPRIMLGETNTHASLNNGMGFSNLEMRGRRPNGDGRVGGLSCVLRKVQHKGGGYCLFSTPQIIAGNSELLHDKPTTQHDSGWYLVLLEKLTRSAIRYFVIYFNFIFGSSSSDVIVSLLRLFSCTFVVQIHSSSGH